MKQRLVLVRHADTVAKNNSLVGKNDLPLSKKGMEDATRMREKISIENPDVHFYSSTLSRAIQTGEILFPGKHFSRHPEIDEVDFGQWSGMDVSEISGKYPEEMDKWSKNPMSFQFPGGESVATFILRINNFVESEVLPKANPCVVVCHGGSIRFIICRMLNLDYTHHLAFVIHRPSLIVIDHDGKSGVLSGLNVNELSLS